ncbi:MAG: glucose-6-phosphate isomerase family protein, partial [Candidatus Omnitrophica bacterium]|nr:glucose-6-phosphate isomerase family protein [Candidatus Omnitrophota bacterium]
MNGKARKILSLVLSLGLLFQQIGFAQITTELNIANRFARMANSLTAEKFRPVHLRYFSYDALNDNFKVLLDKGDLKNVKNKELANSTRTLLNYFLVGVTLPDSMFWVNLRPDSEDQIIDQYLEKTDVGRIMLESDLQLKRDTALLTSPATPIGKEYWDKLYKKAEELYGYQEVTIPTLTRPWIVPGEIIVRESKDSAYVYKANLKVMLEQDYLKDSSVYNFKDSRAKALNEYSSQLIRELIIPKLTKEVNSSKRYAPLRQVYYSLILSRWFKLRFTGKTGTYASLINTKDLTNLISKDPWSKTEYFKQYQESFAKGEYNIQQQVATPTGQVIRSYFSGGINVASSAINTQNGIILVNDNARKLGDVIGGKAVVDPRSINLQSTVAASPVQASELNQLASKWREELNNLVKECEELINDDSSGHNVGKAYLGAVERQLLEHISRSLSIRPYKPQLRLDHVIGGFNSIIERLKQLRESTEKLPAYKNPDIGGLPHDLDDQLGKTTKDSYLRYMDKVIQKLNDLKKAADRIASIRFARISAKLTEIRKNSGLPISTAISAIDLSDFDISIMDFDVSDNKFWSDVLGVLRFSKKVYRRVESVDIKDKDNKVIKEGEITTGNLDDKDNKGSLINELGYQYNVRTGDFKSIRLGSGVKDFLENENAQVTPEAYFMHRGVYVSKKDILKAFYGNNKLRFDITILPPATWGREYAKTIGHYHYNVDFPEIYQVVSGEVLWLMQKCNIGNAKTEEEIKEALDKGEIEDFIAVRAKAGDIVIMLPGYGHVSVNISETEPLVMADWLTWNQKSYYGSFKNKRGAAYYVIRNAEGQPELRLNPQYAPPKEMRQRVTKDQISEFGLKRGEPIYNLVKLEDKDFIAKTRFLYHPKDEKYKELLTVEKTTDNAKPGEQIKVTSSPLGEDNKELSSYITKEIDRRCDELYIKKIGNSIHTYVRGESVNERDFKDAMFKT